MSKKLIIVVLIAWICMGTISYAQTLDVPKKDENIKDVIVLDSKETIEAKRAKMTIPQIIEEVSPIFGQDPKLISKVAYCESHFKVVDHDGGYGMGVTGIHRATFNSWLIKYKKESNGETLNYNSSYDQLKMMAWAFSKGDSYRNQWTTYVAIQKGGSYSFYSKLLQKNFTVRCK